MAHERSHRIPDQEEDELMIVDPEKLRYEMGLRGLTGKGLARASGVSQNTITNALHGQPIHPGTLLRITSALLAAPPLRMAEALLAKPPGAKPAVIGPPLEEGDPGGSGDGAGGR